MAGRTIIIASHAVESLAPIADKAIFLEDGTSPWQGSGPALLQSEYMAHLKTSGSSRTNATEVNDSNPESASGSDHTMSLQPLAKQAEDFVVQRAPLKTPRQVLLDEKKVKGAVDIRHWIDLMKLNGGVMFFAIYAALIASNAITPVLSSLVLK